MLEPVQPTKNKIKAYRMIGMMSGTSLDGVDLVCCFYKFQQKWTFKLQFAKTYPYPQEMIDSINIMQNKQTTFLTFKNEELKYSKFISNQILSFIQEFQLSNIDYLSLHGHTIFHHPNDGITIQVGNLSLIAAITKMDVIGNFRELDVMRGGEGAPLAPYGEELFQGDIFINFGGVANIGCKYEGWDINYCNLFFNHFAKLIDESQFDKEGSIGRKGFLRQQILYYLMKQWIPENKISLQRQKFQFLLAKLIQKFSHVSKQDILTTYYHFLATQIINNLNIQAQIVQFKRINHLIQVVCTGGGAKNIFLIELLKNKSYHNFNFVVPNQDIVDFKEAIIFGFLGVKFLENISNCSKGIGGILVKGRHHK